MLDNLVILTDAEGYTTSVLTMEAVLKEVGRRPMMAPIQVWWWECVPYYLNTRRDVPPEWRLRETFPWNGAPF